MATQPSALIGLGSATLRSKVKAAGREFPMYGISIDHVLQAKLLVVHEELLQDGLVTVYGMRQGHIIFISHTWFGKSHPDPSGYKLRLLQRTCAEPSPER